MSNSFEYGIYLILSLFTLRIWLPAAPLVSLSPQVPNPSIGADVGPAFLFYLNTYNFLLTISRKGDYLR